MPRQVIRRSLWTLGFAALVAAALAAALPLVASKLLVRDRIAVEIQAWSGLDVSIPGSPEIEVWPKFRAVLSHVSLSDAGNPEGRPLLFAERMEIDLSPMAALRGEVAFSTVNLISPTLRVETVTATSGSIVAGRIAKAVAWSRRAVAEGGAEVDPAAVPHDEFGAIQFREGRIIEVIGNVETELATGLSGRLNWRSLRREATLAVTGVRNGEGFRIEVSAARALLLLGGGASQVSASLSSDAARFSFDGNAALFGAFSVDGRAHFSSPSLRRLLELPGGRSEPGKGDSGSVGIDARLIGDSARIRVEDAEVSIEGSPGRGALQLSLSGEVPLLSGTLAFDALDIGTLLTGLLPAEEPGAGSAFVDPDFGGRMNVDLRLSAGRARIGQIELGNVAATARVDEKLAAFDISDATVFRGSIQASLRLDKTTDGPQAELRLLATAIDGNELAAAAGMTRLVPAGTGTVSLQIKGQATDWKSMMQTVEGSVAASFGAGSLSGLDIEAFTRRASEGGFFPLDSVADGALATDSIEVEAVISKGVATIERAEAVSLDRRVVISGLVPLAGRGLALSGRITSVDPPTAAAGGADAGFFVGGSWDAPLIAPVSQHPALD